MLLRARLFQCVSKATPKPENLRKQARSEQNVPAFFEIIPNGVRSGPLATKNIMPPRTVEENVVATLSRSVASIRFPPLPGKIHSARSFNRAA